VDIVCANGERKLIGPENAADAVGARILREELRIILGEGKLGQDCQEKERWDEYRLYGGRRGVC
jgi:hypothetical protein